MEAATALTQLVSAPTTTTAGSAISFPNSVTDDDRTMTNSPMSLLRANHLKALEAASLVSDPPAEEVSANLSVRNITVPPASAPQTTSNSSKEKAIFPMRLHSLLADSTVRDVISWLPHGKSFVILRPDAFATQVLPRYFAPEGSSKGFNVHKYPSFTRKLNRWGFKQISRGSDAGAFFHEMFRRDEPEACRGMVCQKSRKALREDCKSISSSSTISFMSGEKRLASATTVTVSTGGASRSLPFKKRRGINPTSNHELGIPTNVETKPNNTSLVADKVSVSSDTETVSNISSDGSIKSIDKGYSTNLTSAAAKEALARHFYEQHRAFALAALMENSRKAMLAVGMNTDNARPSSSAANQSHESLGATANPNVFATTTSINEDCAAVRATMPQHSTAAEAAKRALYEAYKKALSSSS